MPNIERIVLEIVADTTELQPAIDQLEALGTIDKKSAEIFRKTNQEIASRVRSLDGLKTAQTSVSQGTAQIASSYEKLSKNLTDTQKILVNGASSEAVNQFAQGITDALNEAGVTAEEFSDKLQAVFNGSSPIAGTEKTFTSLRAELRAMKQELATLDPDSARFKELSVQAGELEDKIGDVNLQVRNLASDTALLDGTIQSIQGVAGAFQVAQGAAVLFGDENEDLQKTLVQLTALMNLTNGLQQIQTILQKQSAASLLVTNVQQKLLVASKALEGAVESKNIIIRTAAIATQKALNAAQAASPTGLLAVALASLAVALFAYADKAKTAEEEQTKLNEAQLEALRLNERLDELYRTNSNQFIRNKEQEIAILRAQNADAVLVAQKELELAKLKNQQIATSIGFSDVQISQIGELQAKQEVLLITLNKLKQTAGEDDEARIKSLESEINLIDAQISRAEKLRDDQQRARTDIATAEAGITKARQDAAKKAAEEEEKLRKARREAQLQRLQDEKAFIEQSIIEAKKGSEEETGLRLALVQKQAQIDLFSLEGTKNTEAQRNLIIAKAGAEAKGIRTDAERAIIEAILDEQQKLLSVDQNNVNARLQSVQSNTDEELRIKLEAIELEADAQKLAAQSKFLLSEQSATDEKLFASEVANADAEAAAKRKKATEDLNDFKRTEAEKTAELEKQLQDTLTQYAFSAADQITAYISGSNQQAIQRQESAAIESLEFQKNKELSNKKLTEEQKLKIEENYKKQLAKIKLDAWESQQQAAIKEAEISGALAILAILADRTLPVLAKPAAIALAITTTLLQIGKISSQEPPKFYKGVERLHGPGTETSDSIPALLSKNERVVPADVNNDYFPALSAIHNRKVAPKIANLLLAGNFNPKISQQVIQKSEQSINSTFDYNKIGVAVADNLFEYLEEGNEISKSIAKGISELPSQIKTDNKNYHNRLRIN